MLRIHLNTGTAWTKSIEVDGSLQDDLLQLIGNYYEEKGELPVATYTMEELCEMLCEMYDEQDLNEVLDEMLPINGGEFWIVGISHVEEI